MNGLLPQLEEWWNERNALLHGIAKSPCGQGPDIPAEEFVARAEKAAKDGFSLTRKVSRWTQKQVAKSSDRWKLGVIAAVLWFVLPVTFGCVAAAKHGLSFWLGFLLGALANGVLRFLWRPFGF